MSISLVQTVQGNGGGYTNSYTKSITPTAGNLLTICLADGAPDTITVTDNHNTWHLAKTQILTSQRQAQIWYAYNVAGSSTTITFQANGGQFPDSAVIIQEWSGALTTDPLDKTVGANTSSGTTYASGSTATTTQASELVLGCIAADANSPGYTGDANFTNLLTQDGFDLYTSVATQYELVSSTGAYNWTLTNGSARQASQAVATFKSATLTISVADNVTAAENVSRSVQLGAVSLSDGVTAGEALSAAPVATLVQTVQGNGGGYVNSYTKSITPSVGNFLTIVLVCGANDVITVTDDHNTWHLAKTQILESQRQVQIWYAFNVAGSATTITFRANGGQFPDSACIIQEWGGMPTTDSLDQVVGANTIAGTTYASGNAPTTTQATELLIGGIGAPTNSPAFTGDALWTNLLTQAGSDVYTSAATQYRIVSSTGAYGWTLTNSSALEASQALATFRFTPAVSSYSVSIADNLTVADVATVTNTQLSGIAVADNVTAAEALTVTRTQPGDVFVADNVTAADVAALTRTQLGDVSVTDNLTAADVPSASLRADSNTISRVQTTTATSVAAYVNTLAVVWGQSVTAGDYLSLAISTSAPSSTSVLSVTDSSGNTWVQRKVIDGSSQSVNVGLYYFDCANCLGGTAPTITITLVDAEYDNVSAIAAEYSNVAHSAQIDVTASSLDGNYVIAHSTGTTGVTAQAYDLVIAAHADPNPAASYTIAAPYSTPITQPNVGGYLNLTYSDKVVFSTGTQTASFSSSAYTNGIGLIVAIKAATSSFTTPAPDAPIWVTAPVDSNRAYVSWSAPRTKLLGGFTVPTSITGFTVKRGTAPGGPYTPLASGITDAFYDDTTVVNGTTYYYVVTATSAGGTSGNSAEVRAAVAAPTPHADGWYAYGAAPTGVSQATIRGYLRAHWDKYVSYCLTNQGGGISNIAWGAYRISAPDQQFGAANAPNGTVSEGIGYGMLAAVYMSNPANPVYDVKALSYFHGLLAYYQYWGDTSWTGSKGLMNWIINNDGTQGTSQYGATDADLDATMALFMMHRLRGSGNVDYLGIGNALASQVLAFEFTPAAFAVYPNMIMAGDGWNYNDNVVAPDYIRFAYFPVFADHTQHSRWNDVRDALWTFIATNFTNVYSTGLVSDSCKRDGTLGDALGWGDANYGYNAIRMGFGYTLDYLWNGRTEAYNNQHKMATSAITRSGNNVNNLGTSGSVTSGPSGGTSQAFAGSYGSAATVDASTAAFAGSVATYLHSQVSENSYFGLSQGLLNLLLLSGEFTPTIAQLPGISVSDGVTAAENVQMNLIVIVTDLSVSVFDSATTSELISPQLVLTTSVSDNVTAGEAVAVLRIIEQTVFETVTAAGPVALERALFLPLSDSVAASENVAMERALFLSLFDSVTAAESIGPTLVFDSHRDLLDRGIQLS